MSKLIDLAGLAEFKEKLLALVQQMINSASTGDADRVVAIESYIALWNGYYQTDLNYRDYLHCSTAEVVAELDALYKAFEGVN